MMKTRSASPTWLRWPGILVLLIALLQLALHLWTNAHDNLFRDELYYVAAGQHLSPGYVEYPPFVALVARGSEAVFGDSVVGLRLLSALAGAAIVFLTAGMVALLGGGPAARVLAAVAAGLDGTVVAVTGLLSMDPFDPGWHPGTVARCAD